MKSEHKNEIIIYQTEDAKTKIDMRMGQETVWLTINAKEPRTPFAGNQYHDAMERI